MNLHLDLTNGIDGDMLVGALLDSGLVSVATLRAELDKLSIRDDFELVVRDDSKNGTRCKSVMVLDKKEIGASTSLRGEYLLKDILKILVISNVSEKVKLLAGKIFENLARAVALSTDIPLEEVDLSRYGTVENIVNIVSAAVLLTEIHAGEITATSVNTGSGKLFNGRASEDIPTGVVKELLSGIPAFSDERKAELTTAAGAAIIKTVVNRFEEIALTCGACGKGGGELDFAAFDNVLTVYAYEPELKEAPKDEEKVDWAEGESIGLDMERIVCNVYDFDSRQFEFLVEMLLSRGAENAYAGVIAQHGFRLEFAVKCEESELFVTLLGKIKGVTDVSRMAVKSLKSLTRRG